MNLDKWFKGAAGIGIPGLIVLYATYGEKFTAALAASFVFLGKLAHDAPLGVTSFLLALALATLAQAWLARFITVRCAASKQVILSGVGLAFGVGVMFLQLRTLDGLLLGLLAGFAAPFAYQCAAALAGLLRREKATP